MKRGISILIGVTLISFGIVAVSLANQGDRGRDEIIAQRLDCTAKNYPTDKNMGWADICYTTQSPAKDAVANIDATPASGAATSDSQAAPRSAQVTLDTAGKVTIAQNAASAVEPAGDEMDNDEAVETEEDRQAAPPATPAAKIAPPEERMEAAKVSSSRMSSLFEHENPLSKWELEEETFYYIYREPNLMRQKGFMNGIHGAYTYRSSLNRHIKSLQDIFSDSNMVNMYKIEARFAYGALDYASDQSGKDNGIPNYSAEIRGLVGYDIPVMAASRVTPFLGFGVRYLLDDGGGRVTDLNKWGYDRESRYFYIPVGLETEFKLKERWLLSITAEYDIFVSGKQVSHLEDGGTGLDTLENDQTEGYGLQGSFRITRTGERIDLFVEPFVRYWNISNSDVEPLKLNGQVIPVPDNPGYVYAGLEPENNTTEYGMKFGLKF